MQFDGQIGGAVVLVDDGIDLDHLKATACGRGRR